MNGPRLRIRTSGRSFAMALVVVLVAACFGSAWVAGVRTTGSDPDVYGQTTTFLSNNAGTSWTKVAAQPWNGSQAVFIDRLHAWTWQSDGPLEVTADGGLTWTLVTPGSW